MYLIHQGKENPSLWEVAWMWVPHFLAQDKDLHLEVDRALTEKWSGTKDPGAREVRQMHDQVIEVIVEKYKIPGLGHYLSAILEVQDNS